jgi:hypothetical protein
LIAVEVAAARSFEEDCFAQVCTLEEACEDTARFKRGARWLDETEAASVHLGANECGVNEPRLVEPRVVERGIMKAGALQGCLPEIGTAERGLVELGAKYDCPCQIAISEVRAIYFAAFQNDTVVLCAESGENAIEERGGSEAGTIQCRCIQLASFEDSFFERGIDQSAVIECAIRHQGEVEACLRG